MHKHPLHDWELANERERKRVETFNLHIIVDWTIVLDLQRCVWFVNLSTSIDFLNVCILHFTKCISHAYQIRTRKNLDIPYRQTNKTKKWMKLSSSIFMWLTLFRSIAIDCFIFLAIFHGSQSFSIYSQIHLLHFTSIFFLLLVMVLLLLSDRPLSQFSFRFKHKKPQWKYYKNGAHKQIDPNTNKCAVELWKL